MPARRWKQISWIGRGLQLVERVGNALPHPGTLFAMLSVGIIALSWLAARMDLAVVHPGTGEEIRPVSLMTQAGLHRILTTMVTNFTSFAPLGTVLVALLGIGIAEASGLIGTVLRLFVLSAPRRLLTVMVVVAGTLSNTASEVGYVLLVPMAAVIFLAAGRHPVAGMAAAFAGVSGGYSANLFLGTIDPLLAGLSEEAAHIVDPGYMVGPTANYYFMAASTFLVAVVATWVTNTIVEPRLGKFGGGVSSDELIPLSRKERRGLMFAGVTGLAFVTLVLWGLLPADGFLRDPNSADILRSPFFSGIVAFIFLGGAVLGIAYGLGSGTFRSDTDVMKGMGASLDTMGGYLVLVFFAAQFVAFFNWTNLGLIFAVKGADALQASGLGAIPLMLGFVLLSGFINIFMGSASAKWAIMAPVFVPMFMILGYTPELVQAAYRVGDSVTNIISPMLAYFALIVAMVQKYDRTAGIGTVVATMLPYTAALTVTWMIFLVIWMLLGLPVGPGAGLYL